MVIRLDSRDSLQPYPDLVTTRSVMDDGAQGEVGTTSYFTRVWLLVAHLFQTFLFPVGGGGTPLSTIGGRFEVNWFGGPCFQQR